MANTLVEYAVLAAVPDPRRGERINIALLGLRPGKTDVRALKTFAKLRALDPNLDTTPFEELASLVARVTEGVESIRERLALLGNLPGLAVVNRGQMLVAQDESYDSRLDTLFRRHVLPPPAHRGQQKYSRLHSEIRKRLVKEAWLGESAEQIEQSLVVEYYVLDPLQNLYAQFAMKNGSLWVIETLDLRAASDQTMKHRFGQAAISSLVFDEAKRQDTHANAIAVYAAKAKDEAAASHHLRLLEREAQRLFNYESKEDRQKYFEMIGAALTHGKKAQADMLAMPKSGSGLRRGL